MNPYENTPRLPFSTRAQRVVVAGDAYLDGDEAAPTHLDVKKGDAVYRVPLSSALTEQLLALLVEHDRPDPVGAVLVVVHTREGGMTAVASRGEDW